MVRFLTLLGTASLLFLSACKKYPEGPALSLRSKKTRLSGEWSLERLLKNGNDSTAYFQTVLGSNHRLILKKHGVYSETGNFAMDGNWRFDEEKEFLILAPVVKTIPETSYEILRLKNRSLWLRHTDASGSVTEKHYAR